MTPFNAALRPGARAALLLLAGAAAFPLAGCKTASQEVVSTSTIDYTVRHPIGLVNAPSDLDLFLARNDSRLDERQGTDLDRFAEDYRRNGRGPMQMMVPSGQSGYGGERVVRAALAEHGIRGSNVRVATYRTDAGPYAAPIRLSFAKLQAKVMTKCGQWPEDINGNAASLEGWQNRPYYNLGCSYQTMIANQVDDPIDLVRPRAETPPDVNRRMKVFDDARKAVDPSTGWKTGSASVSGSTGGGN
jgi:pilus assembly protein CpaD